MNFALDVSLTKEVKSMKTIDNQILVIFGASGDLTVRKLVPSVYNLHKGGFLPENFALLGASRSALSDEDFRNKVVFDNPHIKREDGDESIIESFAQMMFYQSVNTKEPEDYKKLLERLNAFEVEKEFGRNFIFYLSTPPSMYEIISRSLNQLGLHDESQGYKRLIVEKPFGYDLESAKKLNRQLLQYFEEEQIYRIDHYLGKETVQNLLVTRFANSIFEPLWNRNYINHIEITSAESVGVEKRGGYYDTSGALRDMLQNHLLQLVALVAMEPPIEVSATAIRNEKVKLFQSLRPFDDDTVRSSVIRGQYIASNIKGESVNGYREEEGVPADSKTETYCAMKFFIDNWRWAGVPFYIRTGKKLPTRVTEVVIHFKPVHHHLFVNNEQINSNNILVMRIQPNEGILLKFGMKVPGAGYQVKNVNMDFHYSELNDTYVPDAYERLILDAMQGDATLYMRGDAVEAAWEFVDPILKAWKEDPNIPVKGYPAGTWGPDNADDLVEGKEITWRYPCKNLTSDGDYCEL